MSELACNVPLPDLAVLSGRATVVVDFVNLVAGGLYPIVVPMMTLPPSMTASMPFAETGVFTIMQNHLDVVRLVIESECHWFLNVAVIDGDVDLLPEETSRG